ncbi:hypothetical protein ACS0TY_004325 [Phlomoides rotata]
MLLLIFTGKYSLSNYCSTLEVDDSYSCWRAYSCLRIHDQPWPRRRSSVSNFSPYCVVDVESIGRQVPIAYLERVLRMILPRNTVEERLLQLPKLKEQMQYCVDHPEEISKIAKVKAQVSEVKGVLDRGEKIELLVDKTENLRSQAQDFRTQGTQMRRKMWLQNMKIKLIVLAIIVALILIIVLSVCGGFKCH